MKWFRVHLPVWSWLLRATSGFEYFEFLKTSSLCYDNLWSEETTTVGIMAFQIGKGRERWYHELLERDRKRRRGGSQWR